MGKEKKIRVLISKCDQDAHEYNVRYLARLLKEAGVEVVFTRYQIIDEVVETALQESVDAIGLSFYSSGVMYDAPRVMSLLKEKKAEDIIVVLGGTINEEEKSELLNLGVSQVFTPGQGTVDDVVDYIVSQAGKISSGG